MCTLTPVMVTILMYVVSYIPFLVTFKESQLILQYFSIVLSQLSKIV